MSYCEKTKLMEDCRVRNFAQFFIFNRSNPDSYLESYLAFVRLASLCFAFTSLLWTNETLAYTLAQN